MLLFSRVQAVCVHWYFHPGFSGYLYPLEPPLLSCLSTHFWKKCTDLDMMAKITKLRFFWGRMQFNYSPDNTWKTSHAHIKTALALSPTHTVIYTGRVITEGVRPYLLTLYCSLIASNTSSVNRTASLWWENNIITVEPLKFSIYPPDHHCHYTVTGITGLSSRRLFESIFTAWQMLFSRNCSFI